MNSYSLHDFRTKVQGIPVSPTPSGEPTIVTAPDAVYGSRLRHRVATLCSGFGGLTATKALRHAEVNITDAVVFLVRITAQGTSYVVNQTPLWLQVIPAIAGLAATIGALIALHVTKLAVIVVVESGKCVWAPTMPTTLGSDGRNDRRQLIVRFRGRPQGLRTGENTGMGDPYGSWKFWRISKARHSSAS